MKNNRHGKAAILKPQEYANIRKAINSDKYKLLLDIAWFTGERWGAILKLEISDVFDEDGSPKQEITFKARTRKANPDGSRRTRQVPIHETLLQVLKNYRVPHGSNFLFPNRNRDKPMALRYADKMLRCAVDRAGLSAKGISTHSTRRTFITQLWRNGADLKTLMNITGHKSIAVLEKYIEADPQRIKTAINLL
ncbi:MAG: site-specific integrase [Calothrix sp. MO_167.B42]|nr:site-specific integrase [Calothrix sp. MO_167.B42]